jgi:hypothetical protein
MTERLVPLPATQVTRVQSPVPARPTISVDKLALYSNPASGGMLKALQYVDLATRQRDFFVLSGRF